MTGLPSRAERQPLDRAALMAALEPSGARYEHVDVLDAVDSTNAEAARRPRAWTVVCADHQSSGRGRMARRWEAPTCSSLAVTAVLPLSTEAVTRSIQGWLPLLAGLAMTEAVAALWPGGRADAPRPDARLKWPNDVLLQEDRSLAEAGSLDAARSPGRDLAPWRKVGGVLCELLPRTERRPSLVVVGAGLNVDQQRDELPVDTATSLLLCGRAGVGRELLIAQYLAHLARRHQDWSAGGARLVALREQYRQSCLTIDSEVRMQQVDGSFIEGRAIAVDDTGRLLVETLHGVVAQSSGDVVHVRPATRDTPDSALR